MSAETGLRIANVFHAGDGNLHPMVLYDGSHEGEEERALDLSYKILQLCVDAGGSITGEHGVGREKQCVMSYMFAEPDLATMHRVRHAFDPAQPREPREALPHTAPLRRALARLLRSASHRSRRPRGGLLMLAELNIETHQLDGITVLSPANTDEVAAILRAANAESLAVEPTGGHTKLTWGSRVTPRLQLSTTHLTGIREHIWQDMTATVAAGTPWSAMQRELARHNQRVALDPVFPDRATVGGIIATNDCGQSSAAATALSEISSSA